MNKDIPIINTGEDDFKEKLNFHLWSVGGSSDYRNDRERPYNGQPWTDHGERGKTEIKGVTMRDLFDCFIMAVLESSPSDKYLNEDFLKCWDFSTGKASPTQFLIDNQNESDYISTKVDLGTWRPQDVYKIDLSRIDLLAVAQNLTCRVEKMMNIYPNIPNATNE